MVKPGISKIEVAKRHVEGGRRIIAAQESLIAGIEAKGGDATFAHSLLDSFRRTQAVFEDDFRDLTADAPARAKEEKPI